MTTLSFMDEIRDHHDDGKLGLIQRLVATFAAVITAAWFVVEVGNRLSTTAS